MAKNQAAAGITSAGEVSSDVEGGAVGVAVKDAPTEEVSTEGGKGGRGRNIFERVAVGLGLRSSEDEAETE